MNFLTKLERKFGKFSIPNLTMILVGGFIVGYLLEALQPEALEIINLNPALIVKGQIWRLITWVMMPPGGLSILIILLLMFYASVGRSLEYAMGDFAYTLYVCSGIFFTDVGVLLTYLVLQFTGQTEMAEYFGYASNASTYYLCLSLFLAYAFLYPDRQVLVWFIIPIKLKWLGYIDIAYLLMSIFTYGQMGYYAGMVTVIVSMLNFILFYILLKKRTKVSPTHKKRRKAYRKEVRQTQILTRHKCAACGQTEEDNPNLEFRYCSKCKGNYEYCSNHLFTHQHRK